MFSIVILLIMSIIGYGFQDLCYNKFKNSIEPMMKLSSLKKSIFYAMNRLQKAQTESKTFLIIIKLFDILTILTILPLSYNTPFHNINDRILQALASVRNFVHWHYLALFQQSFDPLTVGLSIIVSLLAFDCIMMLLLVKLKESELVSILIQIMRAIKITLSVQFTGLLAYTIINTFSTHVYVTLLGVLAFILTTCTELLYYQLNFSNFYEQNPTNSRPFSYLPAIECCMKKILIFYSVLASADTQYQIVLLNLVLLFFYGACIGNVFIKKITYYDLTIDEFDTMKNIFLSSLALFTIIKTFLSMIADNYFLIVFSLWFWCTWALKNWLEYKKSEILLKNPSELDSPFEARCYIRFIYNAFAQRKIGANSIILAGIIKEHLLKCTNSQCMCQQCANSEALIKDLNFIMNFILMIMQGIENKFKDDLELLVEFLVFKIEINKQFSKYYHTVHSLRNQSKFKDQFGLGIEYSLFKLEQLFLFQIRQIQRTNQVCSGVIEKEKLFKSLEKRVFQICEYISEIFTYNVRSVCNMNLFREKIEQNFKLMKKMNEDLEAIKQQEYSSLEILLFFFFYCQCVVISIDQANYIKEKIKKMQTKKQAKEASLNYFITCLYSKQGCVLESVVEPDKLGYISNCSKNTEEVFGVSSKDLIGKHLSFFLPDCMHKAHAKILHEWISTGKNNGKINQLFKSYYRRSDKSIVEGLFIIQMAVVQNQIRLYIAVLKKNSQDFMIVNSQGFIEGFGMKFRDFVVKRESHINTLIPSWQNLVLKIKQTAQTKSVVLMKSSVTVLGQLQLWKQRMRDTSYYVIKFLSMEEKNVEVQGHRRVNVPKIIRVSTKQYSKNENSLVKSSLENNFQIHADTSTASSAFTFEYSVRRVLELYSSKAYSGPKIEYKLLNLATVFVFLLVVVLSIVPIASVSFYANGMKSYNQVLYADGAVSDNMQLLEFTYNKITMVYQYCGQEGYNAKRCDFIKDSSKWIQIYLYDLMAIDIMDLVKNNTYLGNPYFFYEFVPINFTLNEVNHTTILSAQFMEYFILGIRKIRHILDTEGQLNKQTDLIYQVLRNNFPEMKRINHLNLDLYLIVGMEELKLVKTVEYPAMAFSLAMLSILFPLIYCFNRSKEKFQEQLLYLYRYIPTKTNQDIAAYYSKLMQDYRDNEDAFEANKIMPVFEKKGSVTHYSYTFKRNWIVAIILAIAWVILVIINVAIIAQMFSVFPTCMKMVQDINDLMDSENYLLENYFDLKNYYLMEPEMTDPEIIRREILFSLDQDVTDFSKIALQANVVFKDSDPTFLDEFTLILVNDVCELTRSVFPDKEYQNCATQMHHQMLEQGVLSTMQYFQRIVFEAVFDLQEGADPDLYFKQKIFQDLDDYIIFMFRLYQATQARMYNGLTTTIQNQVSFLGWMVSMQLVFYVAVLLVWLSRMKQEREQYAVTYGYLLIFPADIIHDFKIIQQILLKYV